MSTETLTQAEKVRAYLQAGREITSAQAKSMWNVANLRARISEIRQEGYEIQTRTNYRGLTAYSLGSKTTAVRNKR